jgi:PmbA protein
VPNSRFLYSEEMLRNLVQDALALALRNGASSAEADASEGFGQSVTVRMGEVETIEHNRDKEIVVTVYFGHRRGNASSSDLSAQALKDTVAAACSIAQKTASDECSGLADESLLAKGPLPDLDLYHSWGVTVEQAIELAKACEAAAFAVDRRIRNSEGASVSTQESHFAYGNTLGFLGGYRGTQHGVSCTVIAGSDDAMQRDYWYSTARDYVDLEGVDRVGRLAGERAVRRLKAHKLKTLQAPVLFEAPVASSLVTHFVSAVSGGSLYRKSTFLLDSLGKQVFSPEVQLSEMPHLKKGLASTAFDSEGVATAERQVVGHGVLEGYFLGSYSARKLGLHTTANAGGNHNLLLTSTGHDFVGLLREMGKGLLVTELLGHGINPVTGDYSRGAAGFWVEQGEIQYPVEEITIAGNLRDMFLQIAAIGNDVLVRGSKQCGSLLIENMTIAGD